MHRSAGDPGIFEVLAHDQFNGPGTALSTCSVGQVEEIIQCVVEEGTVGSARVVQAAIVSPVTSFQMLKRLAISLQYSWAWTR